MRLLTIAPIKHLNVNIHLIKITTAKNEVARRQRSYHREPGPRTLLMGVIFAVNICVIKLIL